MRRTAHCGQFHRWLASLLALGLGLGLAPVAPWQSRAAQIASAIKLDAEDLDNPIVPLFGTTGSSGGTTLAWLASQRSTSSSSSGTTQTSMPTSVAPIEAQTLIPTSITDPITNSKLVKDLEHLFTLKSGRLVNWNQQSLDALKNDLRIPSPKNVAPKALAKKSKPELAAQVIDGTGSVGTRQPAPVPEPGTLAVFGLVAAALAVRQMRSGRK